MSLYKLISQAIINSASANATRILLRSSVYKIIGYVTVTFHRPLLMSHKQFGALKIQPISDRLMISVPPSPLANSAMMSKPAAVNLV